MDPNSNESQLILEYIVDRPLKINIYLHTKIKNGYFKYQKFNFVYT